MDSGIGGTDEVLNAFSVEKDVFKAVMHPAPEVECFDISFEGGEGGMRVDGEVIEEFFGVELGVGGYGGEEGYVVGVQVPRDGGGVGEEQFFAEGECGVSIEEGGEKLLVGSGDGGYWGEGVGEKFDVVEKEGVDGGEVVGIEVFGYFFSDGLGEVRVVVDGQWGWSFREYVVKVGEVGLIEGTDEAGFMHTVATCATCDLPDEMGVDIFFFRAVPFGRGGEVDTGDGEVEAKSDCIGGDEDVSLTRSEEFGLFTADVRG